MKGAGRDLNFFLRLFRPHYRRMGIGTLAGWLAVSASVGLLALSGWFISAAAFAGLTLSSAHLFNFFYPSTGVRVFAITRTLARYTERLTTHDATLRMLATLRAWFYRRLEPLAPAGLMRYRSGDVLNRIVADIESLDNLYVRVLSPSIVAVLTTLTVVIFLGFFDPWIAAAALLFMLMAGMVVPLVAGKVGAGYGRQLAGHTAGVRVRVVEGLQGLSELMVFGAWSRQQEILAGESRSLIRTQSRMSQVRGLATAATTLMSGLAVLVCLFIGVERVAAGAMDGANLALVGLAVLAAFEALLPLSGAYQYLGQTRAAGKRLMELVHMPPAVVFAPVPAGAVDRFDLCFDKVCFRYGDAEPWVLEGFDLRIRQGRKVAIVGKTGAGKSTLFHLLVRFWDPADGAIRVGGCDIRTLAEADLRRMMGVVPQPSHLFNATIRKNLLLARPSADEPAMRSALQQAQLLGMVDSLPDGIDTWIGEGGRTLSGGQARRLCLARVFLQDAPIWLLDEPTEGLDRLTEQHLLQALFDATRRRTLVVITHRRADLGRFDEIVRVENGRMAGSSSIKN